MFPEIKKQTGRIPSTSNSGSGRGRACKTRWSLKFLAVLTALEFSSVATSCVHAQGAHPMDSVAQALDLDPSQLQACLGEPPAPGEKPSEAEHAALIDCLQHQNPELTADQIDAAMGQMRKGPPPKG